MGFESIFYDRDRASEFFAEFIVGNCKRMNADTSEHQWTSPPSTHQLSVAFDHPPIAHLQWILTVVCNTLNDATGASLFTMQIAVYDGDRSTARRPFKLTCNAARTELLIGETSRNRAWSYFFTLIGALPATFRVRISHMDLYKICVLERYIFRNCTRQLPHGLVSVTQKLREMTLVHHAHQ